MNLQDFKVLKEDDDSYHFGHPSGKSIKIDKKGMSKKAHEVIQKLCMVGQAKGYDEGGEVEAAPVESNQSSTSDSQPKKKNSFTPYTSPASNLDTNYFQNYDEGGQVSSEEAPAPVSSQMPDQPKFDSNDWTGSAGVAAPTQAPGMSAEQEAALNPVNTQNQASPAVVSPDMNKTPYLQAEEDAIKGAGAATQEQGLANQKLFNQYADTVKNNAIDLKSMHDDFQKKDAEYQKHLLNNPIDPNRYWNSKGTASKIGTAVAVMLSGLGSGLTGGPNLALDHINKAIERDIDSQKNDQTNNMNAWKMNREQYGNDLQAKLASQNQSYNAVQAQVMANASKASGPIEKSRLAQIIIPIEEAKFKNNIVQSALEAQKKAGTSGGLIQQDPSVLVPHLVPAAQQAAVYGEIKKAQTASQQEEQMMKLFDQDTKDNTIAKTGFGFLRTPASSKALSALEVPFIHDEIGRPNPMAKEAFERLHPAPGDAQSTIDEKREAYLNLIRAQKEGPVAKGNHIDLEKFSSTSSNPAGRMSPQNQAIYQEASQRLKSNPNDAIGLAAIKKLGMK